MNVQFQASTIALQTEDDVVTVAFADDASQPTEVFILQYNLLEEPAQLIYCERNDQSQGCYNGIKRAELGRTTFKVVFNEEGAARVNCNILEICFQIDETKFSQLKVSLYLILNHSGD